MASLKTAIAAKQAAAYAKPGQQKGFKAMAKAPKKMKAKKGKGGKSKKSIKKSNRKVAGAKRGKSKGGKGKGKGGGGGRSDG